MKKIIACSSVIFGLVATVVGQAGPWVYRPESDITFSLADSLSNPFLCATDSTGNLWVLSSTSTSLHAINALYKAAPGDTVFTLIDDYTDDAPVHSARGICAIGNDIFVAVRKTTTDMTAMFKYPHGNFSERVAYSLDTYVSGYGTYVYGISGTKDGFIYGGIGYLGPRIRLYDFTGLASPDGKYVAPECSAVDPGGSSPTGQDVIRDVATIPNADYFATATPIYTSRNSLSGGNTGGVTKWTGGTQNAPAGYTCVAIEDADSYLKWTSNVPNGLTCDAQGNLWAVGTDTTRRWVKCFAIDGNWATQIAELPSATSADLPNVWGAPFVTPEDIALSPDGNVAYVIDCGARRCFAFQKETDDVRASSTPNSKFRLYPAYPNPFNPVTSLKFDLPAAGQVKAQLFDLHGKLVRTLYAGERQAGLNVLTFNAAELPTGTYLFQISTAWGTQSNRITLLK